MQNANPSSVRSAGKARNPELNKPNGKSEIGNNWKLEIKGRPLAASEISTKPPKL
jgi:hypothetical protein